jgi:cytochrome c peroxidase
VVLPDRFGLIDAQSGRDDVSLGTIPDGPYTGLEFTIGLPPGTDAGDASRWPAGHPLNPLTDGLYWGWQGGYVFAAIEGNWREGSGPDRGFSFHLASGAGAMRVRLQIPFEVRGSTTLHCAWDLAGMLRTLRFLEDGTRSSTHSRAGDPLARWLAGAAVRSVGWRGQSGSALKTQPPAASAGPKGRESVPFLVPAGFPQPSLPPDNPLTLEGIALGRALFTDPRLSCNGRQSCATCHQPDHAFADQASRSTGAEGVRGKRHSPSLLNLAWQPAYAWDGSKPRIRDQALAALSSPLEMHGDPAAVAAALASDPATSGRFRRAFGSPAVTPERIGLALEQYLLTLVAADSRFDRAARGVGTLTAQERHGLELFVTEYDPARGRRGADCFHCHGGSLFGDFAYRDNGLGGSMVDRGRGTVTGNPYDYGKFKTPSLRNVALRAPYMHDGSLADLSAVVAHYASGVRRTANLDPNLGKHPDSGMALSKPDQDALVAFLRTLTSSPVLAAPLPPDSPVGGLDVPRKAPSIHQG